MTEGTLKSLAAKSPRSRKIANVVAVSLTALLLFYLVVGTPVNVLAGLGDIKQIEIWAESPDGSHLRCKVLKSHSKEFSKVKTFLRDYWQPGSGTPLAGMTRLLVVRGESDDLIVRFSRFEFGKGGRTPQCRRTPQCLRSCLTNPTGWKRMRDADAPLITVFPSVALRRLQEDQ